MTVGYQDINAQTIDRWVEEGWAWGKPISHDEYLAAQAGSWEVFLTPTRPVPRAWFGDLAGRRVLGLASGGGQQMPTLSAVGALCTVLDYSDRQLESERMVARREGYQIDIVKADMTKPLPFDDKAFDLVFFPVANCYVEEMRPIFAQCWRILRDGGVLLGGFDIGTNFIVDEKEERVVNALPFNPLKNPDHARQLEGQEGGVQFSHTLEELIGGQLEAGFILTHLFEDVNEEGRLAELNIPSFIATRAVKR